MIAAWLFLLLAPPDDTPEAVRDAVRRALVPIQKSVARYPDERSCFSCHHQALPLLALTAARERGFRIDEELYRKTVRFTHDFLAEGKKNYRKGVGQGGKASTAGYALLALEAAGHGRDDVTAAVASFLVGMNEKQGYWKLTSRRPPSGHSEIATAANSVRALRRWGAGDERVDARVARVLEWLRKAEPEDTEDRVFRLRGLAAAGAPKGEVDSAAKELLEIQRSDGGWAQTGDMESDAYATGTVLAALRETGLGNPGATRRGAAWLLSAQSADGTWHVATRAKGFQKYFESGFPYGKDQFISITASCWAVVALAHEAKP